MRDISVLLKKNSREIYDNAVNSSGKSLSRAIAEQADLLRSLVEKYLREYLDNTHNARYCRTRDLSRSVKVESDITMENGRAVCKVYFDENANHRTGFGVWRVVDGHGKYDDDVKAFSAKEGNTRSVNTAYLLNYGYSVTKPVWFKDIPKFGQREGAHFVEDAINEFNAVNSLGIVLDPNKAIIKK